MNPKQVRVIDPILTSVVLGYIGAENVGHFLFPVVFSDVGAGQVIEFDKTNFKLFNTVRARGTAFKRLEFGYAGKPFVLENHGIEVLVPREDLRDAQLIPSIDLASSAIFTNMEVTELRLEYDQAQIARNADNYATENKITLSGTDQWSDPTSDPIGDVELGKEVVRSKTGRYPNTMVISAKAYAALKKHPKIIERISLVGTRKVTAELLAELFELDMVAIGKRVVLNDAGTTEDVWGGDAVLAYVSDNSQTATAQARDKRRPSYGYNYVMRGNPMVESPYFEEQTKSFVYGVSNERQSQIVGADAGYLIQNAVTVN